jgi:hypothetical protein
MKNNRPKLRLIIAPDLLGYFDLEAAFYSFSPNYKIIRTEEPQSSRQKLYVEKLQNIKSYYNNQPNEAFKLSPVYRKKRKKRLKPKTNLKRYFELKKIEY